TATVVEVCAIMTSVSSKPRGRGRWVRAVRSGFRVVHDLPYLLCAPAGGGNLGRPGQRLLVRGHVDDREPADDRLGLRVWAIGDRPVGGDDARPLPLQSAPEDPHARVLGL